MGTMLVTLSTGCEKVEICRKIFIHLFFTYGIFTGLLIEYHESPCFDEQ